MDSNFDDISSYGDGYYRAHLPWAHRKREEAEPVIGPQNLTRLRPAPKHVTAPLPCRGQEDDFDTEEVTEGHRVTCARCPVNDWCLRSALEEGATGVRAGTNSEQRKRMKEMAA